MSDFSAEQQKSLLYTTEEGVTMATFKVNGRTAEHQTAVETSGQLSGTEKPKRQGPPVTIRIEKSMTEFAHLYAEVERQLEGIGTGEAWAERKAENGSFLLGVTSAVEGEGKTTVALHLAMNAAFHSNKQICLIDAGLGDDEIGRRIGASPSGLGVISLLEGAETTFPATQLQGCDNLVIMPSGRRPLHPARAARSPWCSALFDAARRQFDLVIVDLPAVSTHNALPLLSYLDGVLMVTRAGAAPHNVVRHAPDQIGRERVVGLVLNQTRFAGPAWLRDRLLGRNRAA